MLRFLHLSQKLHNYGQSGQPKLKYERTVWVEL